MKKRMKKAKRADRFLALVLTVCMLFTMLPQETYAEQSVSTNDVSQQESGNQQDGTGEEVTVIEAQDGEVETSEEAAQTEEMLEETEELSQEESSAEEFETEEFETEAEELSAETYSTSKPSGSGTAVSPYQITTVEELAWLAAQVNIGKETSAHAKLMNDIVMNDMSKWGWAASTGIYDIGAGNATQKWTPIGNATYAYTGTFDGQGHQIKGMHVYETVSDTENGWAALFGHVASGAKIKNVSVTGQVSTNGKFGAGLVSHVKANTSTSEASVEITGCEVRLSVLSHAEILSETMTDKDCTLGGIVGVARGKLIMKNCVYKGTIMMMTPGLKIRGCSGLVGWCDANFTIDSCYVDVWEQNMVRNNQVETISRHKVGISANITNCYYDEPLVNSKQGTQVSAEQVASGELAQLLQGTQSEDAWGQSLTGTVDEYPRPSSMAPRVNKVTFQYYKEGKVDTEKVVYTNDTVELSAPTSAGYTYDYRVNGEYFYGTGITSDIIVTVNQNRIELEGTGEPGNPYKIDSVAALYTFAAIVNGVGEYYSVQNRGAYGELTTSLDLSAYENWTPMGSTGYPYTGTFDGAGHEISGMRITLDKWGDSIGFFGAVNAATIRDLTVGGSITINNLVDEERPDSVGGLVGYAIDATLLVDCVSKVDINMLTKVQYVGGIVGCTTSTASVGPTVLRCVNKGNIIEGEMIDGKMVPSVVKNGEVRHVGGIVGYGTYKSTLSVTQCVNYGSVLANDAGGILSYINSSTFKGVKNCLNVGEIKDNDGSQGGVITYGIGQYSSGIYQENYYLENTGRDTPGTATGLSNSIATPLTLAQLQSGEAARVMNGAGGAQKASGLWGQTNMGAEGSYPEFAVKNTSNVQTNAVYYVTLDYTNLPKEGEAFYVNTGQAVKLPFDNDYEYVCTVDGKAFDGTDIRADAAVKIKAIPKILMEGEGTEETPYEISNAQELLLFADMVNGTGSFSGASTRGICAKLTADIALNPNFNFGTENANGYKMIDETQEVKTPTVWKPIGDGNYGYVYTGTFDGAGYEISGLYIDSLDNYQGLFGAIEGANIKNLGIVNSYIAGSNNVGAICGYGAENYSITKCYNTSDVKASGSKVGGICGQSGAGTKFGSITECYNTGEVSGSAHVGGICGYNNDSCTIKKCYYLKTEGNGPQSGIGGASTANVTDAVDVVIGKNKEAFQNGEVTVLLNQNPVTEELPWRQNLARDPDESPVLKSTHAVVYKEEDNTYSNKEFAPQEIDGVYQIANADNLYWFAALVNNAENTKVHAKLINDIQVNKDFNFGIGEAYNEQGYTRKTGVSEEAKPDTWLSIGSESKPFTGTFDGCGYEISGIYIYSSASAASDSSSHGLFGAVAEEGLVQNVGVVDSYITGKGVVGGICGTNQANILNCYFTGAAAAAGDAGTNYIGGICGSNDGGKIQNCYSTGVLSGDTIIGGVSGLNDGAQSAIENCYYQSQKGATTGVGHMFVNTSSAIAKSEAEFMSGEVAYLLNDSMSGSEVLWRQTLPADATPVLKGSHKVVYKLRAGGYSNDKPAPEQNASDEYMITNVDELYWFAEQVNGGNTAIKARLMNNIDLNQGFTVGTDTADGYTRDAGTASTKEVNLWDPIGDADKTFTGSFDGQGYEISGIYSKGTSDVQGLFGNVGEGAVIKNVGVVDSYIEGKNSIGGICGNLAGSVENAYSKAVIKGQNSVGGICGTQESTGRISSCYASVKISGTENVGGVCGSLQDGTITDCYYESGKGADVGVGGAENSNTTPKTAAEFVSGEVAYLLNASSSAENSLWRQNLTGDADASPVLNQTHGIVYKRGTGGYTNTDPAPKQDADGIYQITSADELYWIAEQVNGAGAVINAKLMNDIDLNEGFVCGTENADGYTKEEQTPKEQTINRWTPIGNESHAYNGSFDGQGYEIAGIYCKSSADNVGLFGFTGSEAVIQKVGIVASYIEGNDKVGGICGYLGGTIVNCYNRAVVKGVDFVGGICGQTTEHSHIKNSYSAAKVTGITNVGGICGAKNGTLTNCYYETGNGVEVGVGGTAQEDANTTPKTTAVFASGEVAYLLGGSEPKEETDYSTIWRQNLAGAQTDAYPLLDKRHRIVHKQSGETTSYYNLDTDQQQDSDGTFLLADKEDLKWFAAQINAKSSSVLNARLTADIDLNEGVVFGESEPTDSPQTWTPIGTYTNPFAGSFDGDGHVISGVYISGSDSYQGLFGYVKQGAVIRSLGVVNSYISGDSCVGGISGYSAGDIIDCYHTGIVKETEPNTIEGKKIYVGGISGYNAGNIVNCYNTGAVSVKETVSKEIATEITYFYAGGISGYSDGHIMDCYSTGVVTMAMIKIESETGKEDESKKNNFVECYAGGICGYIEDGSISNCYYIRRETLTGVGGSSGTAADSASTASNRTETQFKSGEVAYLLNNASADNTNSTIWRQNLTGEEADASPVLDQTHGMIYANGRGCYGNAADEMLHTWDEGVVTVEPTQETEGLRTYTCISCQETKTESIARLPQNEEGGDSGTGDGDKDNPEGGSGTGNEGQGSGDTPGDGQGAGNASGDGQGAGTGDKEETFMAPAENTTLTDAAGKVTYSVTKQATMSADGTITAGEVAYMGLTSAQKKSATSVSIPATVIIDGITYKVTSIAANAFKNNKKITKVTMGSNITSIGSSAFSGCTKLKTLTLGKNVTTIGANAFYKCTALTKVTIPSKVTTIASSAFSGCTKLKILTLGKNVTTIGAKAFYKCTALTKVTIPSKVKTIKKQAFYGCKKLKSITIKTTKLTTKNVGSKAFKEIQAKATIKVPKSKLSTYRKLLKAKGVSTKAKIKK